VPSNDITQEVPVVSPSRIVTSTDQETTLTMAWRAPKDTVLKLHNGVVGRSEYVRVTDTVGNGPYQVTVTRLTARQTWSARLRGLMSVATSRFKYRVWWPVVDKAEDAWHWLKEH
jgi:hypothetical protein